MLAHKDEYYHQNPMHIGENLFAWPMPAGNIVQKFCPTQEESSPDISRKSSVFGSTSPGGNAATNRRKIKDRTPAVSGKDVAVYWYKTRQYYDYTKDPSVLHAQAGSSKLENF